MMEHLRNKLKELISKQTSAALLSSNVMQETCPDLPLLSKSASFPHAVISVRQVPRTGPDKVQMCSRVKP